MCAVAPRKFDNSILKKILGNGNLYVFYCGSSIHYYFTIRPVAVYNGLCKSFNDRVTFSMGEVLMFRVNTLISVGKK